MQDISVVAEILPIHELETTRKPDVEPRQRIWVGLSTEGRRAIFLLGRSSVDVRA